MARTTGQKLRILYVMDYLKNYSCESNPVTVAELISMLEDKGIAAERKTIYDDISALEEFGLDIIKTRTPKVGYFLSSREFEDAEIYLLADAVRTADFITPRKSDQLIKKLYATIGNNREDVLIKKGISNRRKCSNESIYYNIDAISTAITKHRKVVVEYVHRYLDNREIASRIKTFVINPYALVWAVDKYYLVGNNNRYENLMHIRIDRIKKVTLLDEKRREPNELKELGGEFDVEAYTQRTFNMFTGEEMDIELRCSNDLLEAVIDRFTDSIFIKKCDADTFSFSTSANVSEGLVAWIVQFGGKIEAVSPPLLRDWIKDSAESIKCVHN